MSKSKAKGTHWESAIVKYLHAAGFATVERRTLNGVKDRGDIAGLPGIVIEAKDCATLALSAWVNEAEVEKANDDADVAVVWHHRRGKASPGDAYVTMLGADFVELLRRAEF